LWSRRGIKRACRALLQVWKDDGVPTIPSERAVKVGVQSWLAHLRMRCSAPVVPLAGIEPALLAELDFESSASTSSATEGGSARIVRQHDARRGGVL
jgi:hypothetical protein